MAVLALLLGGLVWSTSVEPGSAQSRSAAVVVRAVRDGQTIDIAGVGRVRLAGIEVPTVESRDRAATPVDLLARRRLTELVLDRWVRLEDEADSHAMKPGPRASGRTRRTTTDGPRAPGRGRRATTRGQRATEASRRVYVFREDGLFVNLQLVREGLARVIADGSSRRATELERAEAEARSWRRGLWAFSARRDAAKPGRERPHGGARIDR